MVHVSDRKVKFVINEFVGDGAFKRVYTIRGAPDRVLLVLDGNINSLVKEAEMLEQLASFGVPAARFEWIGEADVVR